MSDDKRQDEKQKVSPEAARQGDIVFDTAHKRRRVLLMLAGALGVLVIVYLVAAG